jgi:anti-sigma regulatory factor (Ser/Thr protein kinase)
VLPAHAPLVSRLELVAQLDAPSHARRHVRDVLRVWRIPTSCGDDAELCVSELVGNAVRHVTGARLHAAPTLVSLTLAYLPAEACLRIEVADSSPVPPQRQGRPADEDAEGGRGLFLVEAVSKDWGYVPTATGGKAVWCRVPVA